MERKEATLEDIKRILKDDFLELDIFEAWFKAADKHLPYGLYHNLTKLEKGEFAFELEV